MQMYTFLLAHGMLIAQGMAGGGTPLPLTVLRSSWRHDEVLIVLLLAVVSLILSYVPVVGLIFYPFRLLGTFIHELCHGVATILTGGSFQYFVINQNRSGFAMSRGGIDWIVNTAGYVGCTAVGGLLLLAAASDLEAGEVLFWFGVALAVSLFLLRNLFGMIAGILMAGALIYLGMNLSDEWAEMVLLFLAVQVMLDSMRSLFILMRVSRMPVNPQHKSDAQLMREMTGIPAIIWAFLWTMVSVGMLLWLVMVAYGPRALTF
jgi:hypothetical protein